MTASVVTTTAATGTVRPARLAPLWLLAGLGAVVFAVVVSVATGPAGIRPTAVLLEIIGRIPGVDADSGLTARESAIVWQLRLPRVTLALLVGAMLASAGATYQGVFRNPLADPYLLGVAAGAGLGATIAIASTGASGVRPGPLLPLAAFVGALAAVALVYLLGTAGSGLRSPATLILAGVAVAAFLTAAQTYVQMRNVDTIRQVYSWILGRLSTAGWGDVLVLLPYVVVTVAILLVDRRVLDVLSVGDEEAASLGIRPQRTRALLVATASLGTAAAVAVSGLIGFVGIIVPHAVRLLFGTSYRVIVPLSMLFGGAFLAMADLVARTALSPAEMPIGIVTAFLGAPFFIVVLRTSRRFA